MTYQEAIDFLFKKIFVFQLQGGTSIDFDLQKITDFCQLMGNPQQQFPSLHVAGTNGKGSSAHYLAAILQASGYQVGLYTSPHLKDFRERVRWNGEEITEDFVADFVSQHQDYFWEHQLSFFEITAALAFQYFAERQVDIAVIEVGMGGRLDATNIIQPEVCLISNIGYDHQKFLGDTLPEIAGEKAGIIKADTPVVISEYQEEVAAVFIQKAKEKAAPIYFAVNDWDIQIKDAQFEIANNQQPYLEPIASQLTGIYQAKNLTGVLKTIEILQEKGWNIFKENIQKGIEAAVSLTGLKGRYQILQSKPKIIVDVAHNAEGIALLINQILTEPFDKLHIVLGSLKEKDLDKILPLYPTLATYYFCQPDSHRALPVQSLVDHATKFKLQGESFQTVPEALEAAQQNASEKDLILVSGSTFVVAEVI